MSCTLNYEMQSIFRGRNRPLWFKINTLNYSLVLMLHELPQAIVSAG
jgi:hypothetical protein